MSDPSNDLQQSKPWNGVVLNWFVTLIIVVLLGLGTWDAIMALVWVGNFLWIHSGGCN